MGRAKAADEDMLTIGGNSRELEDSPMTLRLRSGPVEDIEVLICS